MSAYRNAVRIVTFPFRAAWILVLIANFLLVATVCTVFAAFIAYALALTISYAFLPAEWTQALWQLAAVLYAQSSWFRAAAITFFVLFLLPILKFWPARDPQTDAAREREARLNDDLIAARQQAQLRAKLRG